MSNKLSLLLASEEKIEQGQFTMMEGLCEIVNSESYKETHSTFEQYVKDRWSITPSRAYQMVRANEVRHDLCTSGTHRAVKEITTERQLRELVDVPTEDIPKVITKVFDLAGDARPSALIIRKAREEVYRKPEPAKPNATPAAEPPRGTQTLLGPESEPEQESPEPSTQADEPEEKPVDYVLLRAKAKLDEHLKGVRLQLGHLGVNDGADKEIASIRRKAGL